MPQPTVASRRAPKRIRRTIPPLKAQPCSTATPCRQLRTSPLEPTHRRRSDNRPERALLHQTRNRIHSRRRRMNRLPCRPAKRTRKARALNRFEAAGGSPSSAALNAILPRGRRHGIFASKPANGEFCESPAGTPRPSTGSATISKPVTSVLRRVPFADAHSLPGCLRLLDGPQS